MKDKETPPRFRWFEPKIGMGWLAVVAVLFIALVALFAAWATGAL